VGSYLFANSALTGFFLFGAIYHFILWSRARTNRTMLLFAIVTLLASINSFAIATLATVQTVEAAQWALNLRSSSAVASVIFVGWLFAELSSLRAGRFLWPFSIAFVALLISTFFFPLAGMVSDVDRIVTPWGETISVLERQTPQRVLLVPVYLAVLGVPTIGIIGGLKLWSRDRVGGALMLVTSVGYLSSALIAVAIDIWRLSLPYVGPIVTAMSILPMAWQVARANEHQAERLVATERRFRAIFDQTFQFIGLLDVDGTLLEANQTALSFAGIRSEDVIGQPFWETPWWTHSPQLQAQLRDAIRAAVRGEVVRFEATHPGSDGQLHHVDFSLKPVHDAHGAVVLLIPEGRDITNRVVAEEQKRKLEQQLVQSQKMEALGQLAGGVAHDFNNLLTVIAGHADMLLLEKRDGFSRYDLEQIRGASERAASMTRQLLAFSRQSVLEPKVINLNTVVAQTEAMLRSSIGENIELIVHAASNLRPVKADPDQISRALLNLALNARDAMPDGGKLVIETRNVDLRDDSATHDDGDRTTDSVLLSMSDTGCGMSPETKARLFEPFYTTKDQGKGTGLGLAVVDGIVKQSGGRIDVYSQRGVGTTFNVYLPATSEHELVAAVQPSGGTPRGSETVLLVEDEPAVRDMTQAALQRHGYTVLPAASGAEALRIARANHGVINVVVTDVVMPGMSGPQLVERLREEHPRLAALFMSGYTSDAVFRHGIETGQADFLQKPFSTSALAAKLRQVLDR
jgi:PAS domain S-box-containing protein